MSIVNIARFLVESAERNPERPAVTVLKSKGASLKWESISFQETLRRCDSFAQGMSQEGIRRGMKVLLAVKPGLDFVPLCFALFKIGAIPVLIDPGMGKTNLVDCIDAVKPEAIVGTWKAHLARILMPKAFQSIKIAILTDGIFMPKAKHIYSISPESAAAFPVAKTASTDMAAIVFTTGSTGAPKGVVYFHEQMEGQVRLIQKQFQISENDVDFPIFPLFALFSASWGIEAVIPDLDPTKPAQADPALLARQIRDRGVTFSIGSPAVWDKLGDWCRQNQIRLDSLKQILMVGAPVRPYVLERFLSVQSDQGNTYTPYGATEALPVLCMGGREILAECSPKTESGQGTCIGRPFPEVEVRIIAICDEAIPEMDQASILPANQIGEIIVRGPIVTREYLNKPEATALSKIRENDAVWHRMGDVGYLDEEGRVWFCGRKAHRVDSATSRYFSVCTEAVFNRHPKVFRSALVGVTIQGELKPAMCVEPKPGHFPKTDTEQQELTRELLALAKEFEHTQDITTILFHPSFPVDIRHNAKIFREKLAVWAQGELKA